MKTPEIRKCKECGGTVDPRDEKFHAWGVCQFCYEVIDHNQREYPVRNKVSKPKK